ncbi:senescence-specific cysteine protease SAG39-like [Magnolia sinica]|uniref:senescence-specific cysteine protease SAG39-like n=1 Tax=Magnolia sinica TaxID=86752 RepID=UPI0026580900|nr:senescence-specific cysteine protease SAG39-like [Magnolia sinica]
MASSTKSFFMALFILGVWASQAMGRTLQEVSMSDRHEQWMSRYGRTYKDASEKELRFKIFKDNVEFIESFNNAGDRSYKLSVNEFADQTNVEFKARRNRFMPTQTTELRDTSFMYENVTVPSSMDWRKKGI